jgi:hypothetical protein
MGQLESTNVDLLLHTPIQNYRQNYTLVYSNFVSICLYVHSLLSLLGNGSVNTSEAMNTRRSRRIVGRVVFHAVRVYQRRVCVWPYRY